MNTKDIITESLRIKTELVKSKGPNSTNGTHYNVRVSDKFNAESNTKDHSELIRFLSGISTGSYGLTTIKGLKGMFASFPNIDKLMKNKVTPKDNKETFTDSSYKIFTNKECFIAYNLGADVHYIKIKDIVDIGTLEEVVNKIP